MMNKIPQLSALLSVSLLLAGCAGDDGGQPDTASTTDAGAQTDTAANADTASGTDSGAVTDTNTTTDTETNTQTDSQTNTQTDTGSNPKPDTSAPVDAGPTDTGTPDTGTTDTASTDTVSTDTATGTDTAAIDAGPAGDAAMQTDIVSASDTAAPSDTTAGCPSGTFEHPQTGACEKAECSVMSKALQDAIKALVDASNDCKEDGDCEIAQTGTACQGTCGAAINKQLKMGFGGKLATIDDKVCKATGYAGKCGFATPGCLAPTPGCVAGKCVYTKPTGGCSAPQPQNTECKDGKWVCKAQYFLPIGKTDCVEATCANKSKAKNEAIDEAVKASQSCSKDDECTVVATSTACNGTCGAAVNKSQAADVEKIVKAADAICMVAGPDGKCPYFTPKCLAPNPGCDGGVCVYAKSP